MSNPAADLIAGTVLSQLVLVRLLEEQGILRKGDYRNAIEKHLEGVSSARIGSAMYDPLRELLRSLESDRKLSRKKH